MPEFLIETYLDHQGTRACMRYDPNSLIYISKAGVCSTPRTMAGAGINHACGCMCVCVCVCVCVCRVYDVQAMDLFDMTDGFATPLEAMARITCPMLVSQTGAGRWVAGLCCFGGCAEA
jgi:homoserine O-acetyltransferase